MDDDETESGSEAEPEPEPVKKLTKKQLRRQKEKEQAEARARAEVEDEMDVDEDESEPEAEPEPVKKLTKKQMKKLKEKEQAEARSKADTEATSVEKEDEEEEEDDYSPPISSSKKNKQKQKALAMAALMDDDETESGSEAEPEPEPVKKLTKKQLRRQKEKEQAEARARAEVEDEMDVDEDESEPEAEPEPVKKLTKKQMKKLKEKERAMAEATVAEDNISEKIEHEVEQEDEDNASITEALVQDMSDKLVIDNGEDEDKKKKKKKDKKEKSSKKDKKEKDETGKDSSNIENGEEGEVKEETGEKKKKRSKAEKEAAKLEKARKKAEKEAKIAAEMQGLNEKSNDKDGDNEVFYGAPDDKAWTDKSEAILNAETEGGKGPDLSLMYGPDGKKLSNKERKKLLKAREAAARAAEFEAAAVAASAEGAQFACSQTAVNENDPQWQNALDAIIPSFNISAAGKILFKDSPLSIGHGRRYGLVGPNGKGKSTLLKMIASRDLKLPPRIDFLYVEQEVVADDTPAVDAVLKADKKRWNLLEEEKILTKEVDEGDLDPKKLARLQSIYDELNAIGAESSESKARRILYGLGFDGEMQTKPTKMFSGGWRMRISLARALFIEPTLLMLDEPTNHLDLNAVIWLDDYLQRWKKTLLIVSHDQDFLNSICEEILHLEDLKVVPYKGNYDTFKAMEKTKIKQQRKNWEKQEKRIRELKRQGQSRNKATETVKKNSKREPGARSKKAQTAAVATGTEAAVKTELIKRPREYTVKLEFSDVSELSRPVIEVNKVNFRYGPKHPVIFEEVDFGIDMDSRICIVGPNGAGKSTLLKILTGEIQPTIGDCRRNPRLRMGIYNQHFVDRLPMGKTAVEHLKDRFSEEDYQSIRNRLGRYGLEGHAHEVVMRDLSGGQKARVVFVELSLQRPHILLLDEPTNNLDIETIDALVDAVNEFNGGIVVVTHDARLIEECDCNLWVVEKQGVTKWEAGFNDYKESILRELEEQAAREAEFRQKRLEAAALERAKKLAGLAKKV